MTTIKVMADYRCWPVWVRTDAEAIFATVDPTTLGLSAGLVGRLTAWQHWWDSRLNLADPHDSREVPLEEVRAFDSEGRLLARRVAQELPDCHVLYGQDAAALR